MSRRRYLGKIIVFCVTVAPLWSHSAYALDWQNLWSTPEQRAEKQLDGERYDELIEQAPDANWRGIGEYRNGDYAAATDAFSQQRTAADLSGSVEQAEQAMYNQANAQTLNERYSDAISLFDEVLESNPAHEGARHNRAIAEQLLEQQQEQEQQDSEDQDSGDSDDDQSSDDQQEGDQQEGDQEGEQGEEQQSDNQQDGQNSESSNDDSDQAQSDSEQQDQAEQQAQAARAMAGEQANAANAEQSAEDASAETAIEGDQAIADPLTEREQANEQWLRQIPDDPAGLLQRKLQNRHLTDFPKVKDSVEPW